MERHRPSELAHPVVRIDEGGSTTGKDASLAFLTTPNPSSGLPGSRTGPLWPEPRRPSPTIISPVDPEHAPALGPFHAHSAFRGKGPRPERPDRQEPPLTYNRHRERDLAASSVSEAECLHSRS